MHHPVTSRVKCLAHENGPFDVNKDVVTSLEPGVKRIMIISCGLSIIGCTVQTKLVENVVIVVCRVSKHYYDVVALKTKLMCFWKMSDLDLICNNFYINSFGFFDKVPVV
jgi:hypothetical protein